MTNGSADTLWHLSTPVVSLDWKEQLRSLRASDSYRGADQASRTLARHPTFRVVLVALKAHGRVDEHHADSVISVHCLDGQIRFELAGAAYELTPGHLLVVTERLPHSVVALAESAFLLTIGKPHHDERAAANERESGMTGGSDGLNHVVARADSVPLHSVQGLVVEDTPICLIRADDGRFYALRDNCTHEDYPLSDGELEDCTVECPRHGSRFDIRTGDVLNPPAVVPVETYRVEVVDGDVVVWAPP